MRCLITGLQENNNFLNKNEIDLHWGLSYWPNPEVIHVLRKTLKRDLYNITETLFSTVNYFSD